MSGRVSQEVVEAQVTGTPAGRASQVDVEVQVTGTPVPRVTQVGIEVQATGTPVARASQLVVESDVTGVPLARATQFVLEVLLVNIEVSMLPIYPDQKALPGLTYNVKWAPTFFSVPTQTTATGADIDLALADTPLHGFELTYDFLRDGCLQNTGSSEFKRMFGFFLRVGGTAGRFLFKNPDDNYVRNETIGTTDGANNVFSPITRTFGVGEDVGVEPIGFWDSTQQTNVYLDGAKQDPSSWSIVTDTPGSQQLKFNSTPAAGKVITMDVGYFYYCKFPDNSYTFEKFMDRLWLLNKINIKSCRPGA